MTKEKFFELPKNISKDLDESDFDYPEPSFGQLLFKEKVKDSLKILRKKLNGTSDPK